MVVYNNYDKNIIDEAINYYLKNKVSHKKVYEKFNIKRATYFTYFKIHKDKFSTEQIGGNKTSIFKNKSQSSSTISPQQKKLTDPKNPFEIFDRNYQMEQKEELRQKKQQEKEQINSQKQTILQQKEEDKKKKTIKPQSFTGYLNKVDPNLNNFD
jgi:hypothetical protein